jgi:N-acylneuraminate cytidylyltransferase
MVSTDDMEIADVSRGYGAVVPFMRSAETSNDFAHTAQVLTEVIKEYQNRGRAFEFGCCLYPTAPFVTGKKLQDACKLFMDSKADCVMPVAEFSFPILRSMKMDVHSKIAFNWPENATVRSQDLPPAYHDCGQYYFFDVQRFLKAGKLIMQNTYGLLTSPTEVQDIDNEEDWKLAELKFSFLEKKSEGS